MFDGGYPKKRRWDRREFLGSRDRLSFFCQFNFSGLTPLYNSHPSTKRKAEPSRTMTPLQISALLTAKFVLRSPFVKRPRVRIRGRPLVLIFSRGVRNVSAVAPNLQLLSWCFPLCRAVDTLLIHGRPWLFAYQRCAGRGLTRASSQKTKQGYANTEAISFCSHSVSRFNKHAHSPSPAQMRLKKRVPFNVAGYLVIK